MVTDVKPKKQPTLDVPMLVVKSVRKAREALTEARDSYVTAKQIAKEAKDAMDGATAAFINAADEMSNWSPTGMPANTPMGKVLEHDDGDDSWKKVMLKDMGIRSEFLKKLAKHTPNLLTLGDLSKWQEKRAGFWVKDIKGLDEAAATEIDKVTANFWVDRAKKQKAGKAGKK